MGSDSNCSQLTVNQLIALAAAKGTCSGLSTLATALVIFFIVLFREYKNFVHRIVLYLAIINLIRSVFFMMQVGAMKYYEGYIHVTHRKLCIAIAVFLNYGSWINILISFWITLNCFLLAVFEILPKKREKWWLGSIVIIPLLLTFWPLIDDRYGLAGAWCGIQAIDEDCRLHIWGLVAQILLGYGPVAVVMAVDAILLIATCVAVLRNYCRERAQYDPLRHDRHLEITYLEAVKEFLPLLWYPIALIILSTIPLGNRIYNFTHNDQRFLFWTFHALASPLQGLAIAMCFLCHPQILKQLRPSKIKEAAVKWKKGSYDSDYSPPRTPIASTAM